MPSGSVGVDLPMPDARLTAPCARPVALGHEALSVDQVKSGWANDRAALVACRDEKAALVEGYAQLRRDLGETAR